MDCPTCFMQIHRLQVQIKQLRDQNQFLIKELGRDADIMIPTTSPHSAFSIFNPCVKSKTPKAKSKNLLPLAPNKIKTSKNKKQTYDLDTFSGATYSNNNLSPLSSGFELSPESKCEVVESFVSGEVKLTIPILDHFDNDE